MGWFIFVSICVGIAALAAHINQQRREAKEKTIPTGRPVDIITSSTANVPGKRVVRQVKVVVSQGDDFHEFEAELLLEGRQVGANAIVNVKITRVVTPGGMLSDATEFISMQADAVVVE